MLTIFFLRVQLQVQKGQDKLLLDRVPDDARHLVSQDVDDGSGLDFLCHLCFNWIGIEFCGERE